MYVPESSFDCINMGGNVRSSALHRVRNQILPDYELSFGGTSSRDDFRNNYLNEVNDQNLPDLNLARNDVNPIGVEEIIYLVNELVLNSNRNGFDLINQRGFISRPATSQPGIITRFKSNSIDFSQSLLQILASLAWANVSLPCQRPSSLDTLSPAPDSALSPSTPPPLLIFLRPWINLDSNVFSI